MSENINEPINSIGITADFLFKVKRVFRQKKSGEIVERYSEKNQHHKVSIYSPKNSHPYIIGHYGVNESLKGSMTIDALLHRDRQDTVVVFLKDWANRHDKPIKRNFFLTFESVLAATTFQNTFNQVLENYRACKDKE